MGLLVAATTAGSLRDGLRRAEVAGAPAEVVWDDHGAGGQTVARVELPVADAAHLRDRLRSDTALRGVAFDAPAVISTHTGGPTDAAWPAQESLREARIDHAWTTTTGDDRLIAILDTGVAPTEEIDSKLVDGYDVVGGDTVPEDVHGHGTMMATVAAAETDDGDGLAGVCWDCRILPVKVLGDDGQGNFSDILQGLDRALDRGADVVSMSLGGTLSDSQAHDLLEAGFGAAIERARQSDVPLVAAAGNAGVDHRTYPAAWDGVVAVGGASGLQRADEGDGQGSNHGEWVDVAAPWRNVAANHEGALLYTWGTSPATALTAGVVALMQSAAVDGVDERDVLGLLGQTARPVGWVRTGVLDAEAAVQAAAETGTSPPAPPTPSPRPEPPSPQPPPDPAPPPGDVAPAPVVPAPVIIAPGPNRLAGSDRWLTGEQIARTYPSPAEVVYLATGRDFPDALSASASAGGGGAPVLLTEPRRLPVATRRQLERLRPAAVVIVGSATVVSSDVEETVRQLTGAQVRRVAGADRYQTSAAVALDATDGPVDVVHVASGGNYPDALAGGAAAARLRGPVLLTAHDRVPAVIADALRRLRPGRVVVLGSAAAVSDRVVDDLRALTGASVRRVAGTNRYRTAAAVTAATFDHAERVYLAFGGGFADALGGAAAAGRDGAPLLLAPAGSLPRVVRDELVRLDVREVVVLGGRIGAAIEAELDSLSR